MSAKNSPAVYFNVTEKGVKVQKENATFSKLANSVENVVKYARAIPLHTLTKMSAKTWAILHTLYKMNNTDQHTFHELSQRICKGMTARRITSNITGQHIEYYTMSDFVSDMDILKAGAIMSAIFGGYHFTYGKGALDGERCIKRHDEKISLLTASFYGVDEIVGKNGETEKLRFTIHVTEEFKDTVKKYLAENNLDGFKSAVTLGTSQVIAKREAMKIDLAESLKAIGE